MGVSDVIFVRGIKVVVPFARELALSFRKVVWTPSQETVSGMVVNIQSLQAQWLSNSTPSFKHRAVKGLFHC